MPSSVITSGEEGNLSDGDHSDFTIQDCRMNEVVDLTADDRSSAYELELQVDSTVQKVKP